jgi:hypothetical protein
VQVLDYGKEQNNILTSIIEWQGIAGQVGGDRRNTEPGIAGEDFGCVTHLVVELW